MKTIVTYSLFAASMAASTFTFGQAKYEKMYFNDASIEADSYIARMGNIVGLAGEIKFALKLTNRSDNFLIYNPKESNFNVDGNKVPVTEKVKLIPADKTKSWTINGTRSKMNETENFDFVMNGIYELIQDKNAQSVDEVKLPLSKNEFSFGDVTCKIKSVVKETNKTTMKITVSNKSKRHMIVHPSRVSARMPDGNSYACANKKAKAMVILPGESADLNIKWSRMPGGSKNDMQLRDMFIEWQDVFFHADAKKLSGQTANISWNESLTQEKNK